MDELEEKAQTVLVSRTPMPGSAQSPTVMCMVDGCLHQATVTCEVRLTHMHLNPDKETHPVSLCPMHEKGFQLLKWQWRRTPDATSTKLKLDGVYAPDAVEDT
jgi:hypothetical protein